MGFVVDIHIIHSKTLTQRDKSVENIIAKIKSHDYLNLKLGEFHIVQSNDPDDIHLNTIQQIIDYSSIQDVALASFNQFTKNIHINQLSHTLKHLDTLQKISKSDKDLHIVLEDDVLFAEDICSKLDDLFKQIDPKIHNLTLLGIPSSNADEIASSSIELIPCEEKAIIPVMESYIVTKHAAEILSTGFLPIKFTTMIQMNYILQKTGVKSYRSSKSIFVNGSKYGTFVSSLNPNNTLVFNQDYMTVYTMLQNNSFDDAKVLQIYENSSIKMSPDLMYLVGKYWSQRKDYKKAQELFQQAYNTALMNGAIVNHESVLLKDFIRLQKHLQ